MAAAARQGAAGGGGKAAGNAVIGIVVTALVTPVIGKVRSGSRGGVRAAGEGLVAALRDYALSGEQGAARHHTALLVFNQACRDAQFIRFGKRRVPYRDLADLAESTVRSVDEAKSAANGGDVPKLVTEFETAVKAI
ncbi:hypothetical protein ABZ611_19010 [Streptomyces sp. NPDC007861]|uniref:hypothetical protein n=1 Tax=Streptomyces sp. NPDC007861 TaxID=3154893 RepID=UPI0033E28406